MCVQALLSFQIDSLDVLTNASVIAKIAACGMYRCILLDFQDFHLFGSPTALRATATEHGYIGLDCQLSVRRLL